MASFEASALPPHHRPLADPALLPRAEESATEARPADDDSVWRRAVTSSDDPETRKAAQLRACEERLERAWSAPGVRGWSEAISGQSCTALKGGPKECVKCRVCPTQGAWSDVLGYYRASKGTIFLCAEKELTQQQVEETLTHELVHAFDHCRAAMRVPLVGYQAPWLLSCAAAACSEVRATMIATMRRHAPSSMSPFGGGGGGFGGGGFGGSGFGDSGFSTGGGSFGDSGFGSDGSMGAFAEGDRSGSSGFSSDGVIGGGGGGGGGDFAPADGHQPLPSAPRASTDPERLREAVYVSSLTSLEAMGRCRQEGRDGRAVLDAVFNACEDDARRARPSPHHGGGGPSGFPAWPADVDSADKGVTPPPPAMPSIPPPSASHSSVPGVDETNKPKWGEA